MSGQILNEVGVARIVHTVVMIVAHMKHGRPRQLHNPAYCRSAAVRFQHAKGTVKGALIEVPPSIARLEKVTRIIRHQAQIIQGRCSGSCDHSVGEDVEPRRTPRLAHIKTYVGLVNRCDQVRERRLHRRIDVECHYWHPVSAKPCLEMYEPRARIPDSLYRVRVTVAAFGRDAVTCDASLLE